MQIDVDSQVDIEDSKFMSRELDPNGHNDDEFSDLEIVANNSLHQNQIVLELNEEQKQQIADAVKGSGMRNDNNGRLVQSNGVGGAAQSLVSSQALEVDPFQEKKHDFDKEMLDFNEKFEEQIEKHINQNAYTDRRVAGSVIGLGIFGGVGFLVFSGTVTFGIGGCKFHISHHHSSLTSHYSYPNHIHTHMLLLYFIASQVLFTYRRIGCDLRRNHRQHDQKEDRLAKAKHRPALLLQDDANHQVDKEKSEKTRSALVCYTR